MTVRTVGSLITPHLCQDAQDAKIARTYVGQAHIAGTGPADKTCRECVFFGRGYRKDGTLAPPSHHPVTGHLQGALKLGRCFKVMPNKAGNAFPHEATACRHFEQNPEPPAAQKAPKPKQEKAHKRARKVKK